MKIDLKDLLANYTGEAHKKVEKYAQEEKTWYYTEVILTLFTISFFIIFAIRPAVITITGLVGDINRKEELSQRMGQKINSVIIAQEEYGLVQTNWELLASFLPSEFSLSQGVAQVVGKAQEENLNLEVSSFGGLNFIKQDVISSRQGVEAESENLSGLSFTLNTDSDLGILEKYISEIRQARRWTQIDNYQLSKPEDKGEEQAEGINLKIDGYWLFWRDKE